MTRESRARWLALATATLVVALSALFAALRNLTPAPPRSSPSAMAPAAPADDARRAAGRAAFERLNCAMCHSIGGRGNPSLPLDGVGARHDAASLRDWSSGSGSAAAQLPSSAKGMKAHAARDPQLDALLAYLATLK